MRQKVENERLTGDFDPGSIGKYVELMIDIFDGGEGAGEPNPSPSPVEPNFGVEGGRFGSGGKGRRRESWRRDSIEDVFPKTPNGQSFLKGKSIDETWRSNSEDEDYLPEGMAHHLKTEEETFTVIDEELKEKKNGSDQTESQTEKGLVQTLVMERAQPKLQVIDEEQSYELDISRTVEGNTAMHDLNQSQHGSIRRQSEVSQFIIPQFDMLSVQDIMSRRGSVDSGLEEPTDRPPKQVIRPSKFKADSTTVQQTMPTFNDSQTLEISAIPPEDNQQTVRITFPPNRQIDSQNVPKPLPKPILTAVTDQLQSTQSSLFTDLETTFKAELKANSERQRPLPHSFKQASQAPPKAVPEDPPLPNNQTINIVQNTNFYINITQNGSVVKKPPQVPKANKGAPNQFSFMKKSKPVYDDRSLKASLLPKPKAKLDSSSHKQLASLDRKQNITVFKAKTYSQISSETDVLASEQQFNIYLPKGVKLPVGQHKRQRSTSFEGSGIWNRNVMQKQALMTGNGSLVIPRPDAVTDTAKFVGRASLKTTPRTPTTADAKRSVYFRRKVYQEEANDAYMLKKTTMDIALLRVMSGMANFDGKKNFSNVFESDAKQQRSNVSEHKESIDSHTDSRFTQSVNMRNAYMRGNPTPLKERSGSELDSGKLALRSTVGARFGEFGKDIGLHTSEVIGNGSRRESRKRLSVEGLKQLFGQRVIGNTVVAKREEQRSSDDIGKTCPVLKRPAVGRSDIDKIFLKAEFSNRQKQVSQRASAREDVNSIILRNKGFLNRVKQSIK